MKKNERKWIDVLFAGCIVVELLAFRLFILTHWPIRNVILNHVSTTLWGHISSIFNKILKHHFIFCCCFPLLHYRARKIVQYVFRQNLEWPVLSAGLLALLFYSSPGHSATKKHYGSLQTDLISPQTNTIKCSAACASVCCGLLHAMFIKRIVLLCLSCVIPEYFSFTAKWIDTIMFTVVVLH